MLSSITWTDYIIVVLLLATTYYLFIGILFYSREIKYHLSGKLKAVGQGAYEHDNASKAIDAVQTEESFNASENTIEQVEELINRLKEAIEEAAKRQFIKEEFTHSLSLILKDYLGLKGSPFQSAINELITSECEKLDFLTLDEQEMLKVWG